jgi:hypothetical protein
MTGVKILAMHGDMLVSPYALTPWTTARMERSASCASAPDGLPTAMRQ